VVAHQGRRGRTLQLTTRRGRQLTARWASLAARSERDVDSFHLCVEVAIDHVLDFAFRLGGVARRRRRELNGDARVAINRAEGNASINTELGLQGIRRPLRVLQSLLEATAPAQKNRARQQPCPQSTTTPHEGHATPKMDDRSHKEQTADDAGPATMREACPWMTGTWRELKIRTGPGVTRRFAQHVVSEEGAVRVASELGITNV